MSAVIAREARDIVQAAARPVPPGATVKAQTRQAWEALGRPPYWRVREAWYGGAGTWSAQALRDLQDRYIAWRDREAERRCRAAEIENAARARRDREELEALRAEHRVALVRVERQLAACDEALALPPPDLARQASDGASPCTAQARGSDRAVGGRIVAPRPR